MTRKTILLELNEIPWRILDDYVDRNPHSALASVLNYGQQFETVSEDVALSPWVTWPTVHRGVTDESHTISDYGQDLSEIDEAYPPLWAVIAKRGATCGVFAPLHSSPLPKDPTNYDFFVPDPFASSPETIPSDYSSFQTLNLKMSRESARNVSSSIPVREALSFGANALSLGIRPKTMGQITHQLVNERITPWTKTRRRAFQSIISFDLFLKAIEKSRPDFSTFFTNHVASSMHRYWAAKFPTDYDELGFDDEWLQTYQSEIDWVMDVTDDMVRRTLKFVNRNREYSLWLASSMGQAATEAKTVHSQVYLRDVAVFMAQLGFDANEWTLRPAMAPRVIVALSNGSRVQEFEEKLDQIRLDGTGKILWKNLGSQVFRIHPGVIQNTNFDSVTIDGRTQSLSEVGFENVVLDDSIGQSAYHVPEGSLVVYNPASPSEELTRRKIPTTMIAPALLHSMDISIPDWMQNQDPLIL